MAVSLIPVGNSQSNFDQSVTIAGVSWLFRFLWNERAQRYFLSIYDDAGDLVVAPRKLCSNIPWNYHLLDGPDGVIWPISINSDDDAGLRDLGSRVFLGLVTS